MERAAILDPDIAGCPPAACSRRLGKPNQQDGYESIGTHISIYALKFVFTRYTLKICFQAFQS